MRPRIYQLETTNVCNARCDYCPHPHMNRTPGFVSFETVEKVYNYCEEIGQKYIALHHMGEPLLHGSIRKIIELFESGGIRTEFSSNGIMLPHVGESVLKAGLSRLRIAVDFKYADEMYRKLLCDFLKVAQKYETEIRIHTIVENDLDAFAKANPKAILESKSFDNWAGEVYGESELSKGKECYFLKHNYVVVLWDGRIVPCCMDYNGTHILGHIDTIETVQKRSPVALCKSCAQLQFAEGGEWEI